MEAKYVIALIGIAMVALLGVSVVSAYGFGGMHKATLTDEEISTMKENRDLMHAAIESGDYETWKSLMEERLSEMQKEITEENFELMQEHHSKMTELREAMEEAKATGDYSEVLELKEEYGMKKGFGHKGLKRGMFAK